MGMFKKNQHKGFTVIELLIVIAIIGILVAILIFNFQESRKQSRDKIRRSDLQSLQLALETYKAQNGRYPAQGCSVVAAGGNTWTGPGPMSGGWGGSTCSTYISGLVPNFIAALPNDPSQEQTANLGYVYTTDTTGSAYKLIVRQSVETEFISSFSDMFARCPSDCGSGTACNGSAPTNEYAVYSAGAQCW
jgi:prepilin-type N-terminal cleavage/methylation domain-containing protein